MKIKLYLSALLIVASSTAGAKVTYDEAKQAETESVAANVAIDAGNQLKAGFSSNDLNGQSASPDMKWQVIYRGATTGRISVPSYAKFVTVTSSGGGFTAPVNSAGYGRYISMGGTPCGAVAFGGYDGQVYGGTNSCTYDYRTKTAKVEIYTVAVGYY